MDRCHRQAGLDQLDPATVDDPAIFRRRHGDRPAEGVGDADAHAADSASRCRSVSTAADTAGGPFAPLCSRHADSKIRARSGTRTPANPVRPNPYNPQVLLRWSDRGAVSTFAAVRPGQCTTPVTPL